MSNKNKSSGKIPLWKILGFENEIEYKGFQFMNRETTDLDLEEMAIYECGGVEGNV